MEMDRGGNGGSVFLVYDYTLAEVQVISNLRLRQSLAMNQKFALRADYGFSSNVLVNERQLASGGQIRPARARAIYLASVQ